jgi:ABC-type phosphate transport system permease subunit
VGAAIFLAELAPPKVSSTLTFLVELLAAVPSVIFGLLAIFALVPLMRSLRAASADRRPSDGRPSSRDRRTASAFSPQAWCSRS